MTRYKHIEQQRFLTTNYNDELIVEEERVKTPEEFEYLEELLLTLDGINIFKMMSIDVKYPFVEYLVSRIKYENLVIARSKDKYMASNIRNYTVRTTGDSDKCNLHRVRDDDSAYDKLTDSERDECLLTTTRCCYKLELSTHLKLIFNLTFDCGGISGSVMLLSNLESNVWGLTNKPTEFLTDGRLALAQWSFLIRSEHAIKVHVNPKYRHLHLSYQESLNLLWGRIHSYFYKLLD